MYVFVTLSVDDRELINEIANRSRFMNDIRDSLDQKLWMSYTAQTFEMDIWDAAILLRVLAIVMRCSMNSVYTRVE